MNAIFSRHLNPKKIDEIAVLNPRTTAARQDSTTGLRGPTVSWGGYILRQHLASLSMLVLAFPSLIARSPPSLEACLPSRPSKASFPFHPCHCPLSPPSPDKRVRGRPRARAFVGCLSRRVDRSTRRICRSPLQPQTPTTHREFSLQHVRQQPPTTLTTPPEREKTYWEQQSPSSPTAPRTGSAARCGAATTCRRARSAPGAPTWSPGRRASS